MYPVAKHPRIFLLSIHWLIFYLNPYREKVRFSLKGDQHREKRFRIYRFLLEHFTDAQRFNITVKINQTILGEHVC